MKELLSIGVDMDYLNDNGKSPLNIACKNKNSKIVRELLKNGANPNLRSTEIEKNCLCIMSLKMGMFTSAPCSTNSLSTVSILPNNEAIYIGISFQPFGLISAP